MLRYVLFTAVRKQTLFNLNKQISLRVINFQLVVSYNRHTYTRENLSIYTRAVLKFVGCDETLAGESKEEKCCSPLHTQKTIINHKTRVYFVLSQRRSFVVGAHLFCYLYKIDALV